MLSRAVGSAMKASGNYDAPFKAMTSWLRSADLAFGNLETAITPGREVKTMEMAFRADVPVAKAMADAGFDVLSLANNHTPNFGESGLMNTFEALKNAGIRQVGAGLDDFGAYQPAYLKANGLMFAFIAQNDSDVVPKSYGAAAKRAGTALLDEERIKTAVGEARAVADVVIFSMHSGTEYNQKPNGRQVQFAHAAIEAGADLVVGHHAHVVQAMEIYKGKPIFFGLGNFIFDQTFSRDTQEGLALRTQWRGRQLERVEFEPVRLDAKYRPDFANEAISRRILARLNHSLSLEKLWSWNDLERRLKSTDRNALVLESTGENCRHDRQATLGKAQLILKAGGLSVMSGETTLWRSEANVWVDDFSVSEVTGGQSVVVTFWRPGESAPQMSLGTLTLRNGKATWMDSARSLRAPICDMATIDLDGGDRPEVIALLGDYADRKACQSVEAVVYREHDSEYDELTSVAKDAFSGLTISERQGRQYFQRQTAP
jgi:poly-gamma-glutamate synthesis protein (capsule biosynthesis protein)